MDRFNLYMEVNLWDRALTEAEALEGTLPEEERSMLKHRSLAEGEVTALNYRIDKASVGHHEDIPASGNKRGFHEYKVCFTSTTEGRVQNTFTWKRYSDFSRLWEALSGHERTRLHGFNKFPSKTQLFTAEESIENSRCIKFKGHWMASHLMTV